MSRLFARTLSWPIMVSGRRMEMVRSVGRGAGKVRRSASFHCTDSVESCADQNARSCSSEENVGIVLRFDAGMDASLLSAHVARGNDADERTPDREADEEAASGVGPAECEVPALGRGMRAIGLHDERFVEE